MKKLFSLIKEKLTKEFILYIVFGVGTTVVNFGVFTLMDVLLKPEKGSYLYLLINLIAWIVAVLFSFFTNKLIVFNSRDLTADQQVKQFFLFVGARLSSLALDELGVFIFINLLHFEPLIVKLVLEVFVVIINYFFSKYVVFKKPQGNESQNGVSN